MFHQWQQHDPNKRPRVARTRTGCLTCRRRKVRCNEVRPQCAHCTRLCLSCSWPPDSSLSTPAVRILQSKSPQLSNLKARDRRQQRQQSPSQSPLRKQPSQPRRESPPKQLPLLEPLQPQERSQQQQQQQQQEQEQPHLEQTHEPEFSEIFNFASFLWENESPTLSFPTTSSSLDDIQMPMSLTTPETGQKAALTKSGCSLIVNDEWLDNDTNIISVPPSFNTISETDLSEFFAHSDAPPILTPVETSSRWSRMRNMLTYMCKNSEMVKNAVMAFAALQVESPRSGRRIVYTQYYTSSREMLTKVLVKCAQDQNYLHAELKHILATIFLLTYIDLLDEDVFKAHGNLRDAFQVIQLVPSEGLGVTERCLLSWLRLLDGRAVSAGGEGLFLHEEDEGQLPLEMESPPDTVDGNLEDAETTLENTLSRPAYAFFQKVLSVMGRISRIDRWHRSRDTVEDETEVMIIAQKITKDIKALWNHRPPIMDHAVACKLVPPLLSPSLANNLTRMLMVGYANYNASVVHLHRVAYKHLPRTPDVKAALRAIKEVTEKLIRIPLDASSPISSASEPSLGSPLPISMLWPLLMLGAESDDVQQRRWVIAAMKGMESIVSNAGITADVLEEVIRRQDERDQRVDIRQVMHDIFTRAFAIV